MNEPHDFSPTVDHSAAPADSLDAGLAAGFGAPSSSLGASQRPVLLREAEGESAHVVKPKSDAMPPPEQTGDRYQLQGEIARGGMGAVLRGRDVDLGRDLAVKVLLEKHAERPEVVRRFIEEAQIGGQLQHPGVVPVYDVGRFGERPYFTMKLVKGQTLAALLGERAEASADRPRFLAIALQVSQALAYAHAKGVIHRDLKPGNVMVGAFGEVQLMDWGLAKVLAEGGIADEERASRQHQPDDGTQIRTARSGTAGSHGTDTEAGSLLGTPAYMPPEQAQGDVAHLDRRADVFGLGAILCEILTGQPPYVGRSFEEVRRKAANGDLADATARLDSCGADQELIALTKACLSPEAIDRPKDAQAVADGLTAYLDGVQQRLHQAELAEVKAKARAVEEAKRRRLTLALAVTVLLAVLGGGVGTSLYLMAAQKARSDEALRAAADNARQERNAEAVAGLLDQAAAALQAGDAAKAKVLVEAAGKRADEGGADELSGRRARLQADLAVLNDLDKVDQFGWTLVENEFPDPAAVAARLRDSLIRFGLTPESVPAAEASVRVSDSAVRDRLVTALDRWMREEKLPWLRAVLRAADPNRYRDKFRDAVLVNDRARMADLAGRPQAALQPPGFVAYLGDHGAIPAQRRRELLTVAVRHRPGDLGLLMALGLLSARDGQDAAAEPVRWFQAAVGVAPRNSTAHANLGAALVQKGQLDEAIACCRKAIEMDQTNAHAHTNLGAAFGRKGLVDKAIASYQKAIEMDPTFAGAYANLGIAFGRKGEVAQAITNYHKAIALNPKNARAHTSLGVALASKGQLDAAMACYRKAIALDPKDARAHANLGAILCDHKRDYDAAIASCRTAIALDPKDAAAHYNLGTALLGKGRLDEAIAHYRTAIALAPKDAKAHCNLGNALRRHGRFAESLAAYQRGHELGSRQPGWPYPSAAWVRQAESLAALEGKLPAFLRGEYQPKDAAERLGLVRVCQVKKFPAAAARLSADTFAADPRLADNLQAGHRYNAACSAALAAAGQGEDAVKLDDTEKARLRKQALDWLRADLVLRARQLETGKPADRAAVQRALRHWQQDSDLTGLRDAAALAKLPAEERATCERLWADVAALLKRTEKEAK